MEGWGRDPVFEGSKPNMTNTRIEVVGMGELGLITELYNGIFSPRQDEDFMQLTEVRAECDRYGMPLVVWSYPRGSAIKAKGGRNSFYAVDYAARVAMELGADVVKLNFPQLNPKTDKLCPQPYDGLQLDEVEAFRQVVQSAGRTMVLVSGGSRISDEDLLNKVRMSLEGGATGLIFGRNMWQRPIDEALALTRQVREIMARH